MDLHDFRRQIVKIKEQGSLREMMARLPELDRWSMDPSGDEPDREVGRIQGIIDSMTPLERSYPFLAAIPGRALRIAEGAGVEPFEVASLPRQLKAMNDLLARLEASAWRRS